MARCSLLLFLVVGRFAVRVAYNKDRPDAEKIKEPQLTGDPKVDRAHRAAANRVEWSPVFFVLMGTSAVYFNPLAAGIAGAVYIKSTHDYFHAYVEDAEKREDPMHTGVMALAALLVMSTLGLAHTGLKDGMDIDLLEKSGLRKLGAAVGKMITNN